MSSPGSSEKPLELVPPDAAHLAFAATVSDAQPGATRRLLRIGAAGFPARDYRLASTDQQGYLDFFQALARDFGTRVPLSRSRSETIAPDLGLLRPLLTEALSPAILYGYGDPSVIQVPAPNGARGWRLLVTSNDAPDAFPIIASDDLKTWRHTGFVFPRGQAPEWALTGPGVSDFWAPELHAVGGEFWVCFAAREHDRSLAIGLARAAGPDGPFVPDPEPLVRGGVIDPHLVLDAQGAPWLFWKHDENDVWPRLLCELLHRQGGVESLFDTAEDRRTAGLMQTLWPWARTLEPMEQFFVLQPLIEAVTARFTEFGERLAEQGAACAEIRQAMTTRVRAQRLAPDGRSLLGEPATVLENDQPWEAHLIEGVWVHQHAGRFYLFYAGNDFSTPHYGVGVAVSDSLLGPYRKKREPLLRTTTAWSGPGHPSVAPGPDGRPHLFLHAFAPGEAAYKAFRALLTTPLTLNGDEVRVGD